MGENNSFHHFIERKKVCANIKLVTLGLCRALEHMTKTVPLAFDVPPVAKGEPVVFTVADQATMPSWNIQSANNQRTEDLCHGLVTLFFSNAAA